MLDSISKMLDQSRLFDQNKSDYLVPRREVIFDDNTAQLLVPEDGGPFGAARVPLTLDDWSLSQVCQKLTVPSSYLRRCPPDLLAHNLNYWVESEAGNQEGDWFVRAYEDRARAVLSGVYSPVSSTWMLETAATLLGDNPYKLIRPYIDADQMHLKVTVKDDPNRGDGGGNFAIGFYMGNGETGNRGIKVAPFIQRISCTNSIVFGANAFEQKHAHIDVAWLEGAIAQTMGNAIKASAEIMNRVVMAERARIPSLADVIERVAKEYRLSDETKANVGIGTEGKETHMGLVNGLSFAAWHIENIDDQIALEELAGAILVEPDSVFSRYELAEMYPNQ